METIGKKGGSGIILMISGGIVLLPGLVFVSLIPIIFGLPLNPNNAIAAVFAPYTIWSWTLAIVSLLMLLCGGSSVIGGFILFLTPGKLVLVTENEILLNGILRRKIAIPFAQVTRIRGKEASAGLSNKKKTHGVLLIDTHEKTYKRGSVRHVRDVSDELNARLVSHARIHGGPKA
ncbi:MAG: hypothetical protein FWH03_00135 [Firmicutes bacterium]|nr:hypothetical protein [Bacillota bacterium]